MKITGPLLVGCLLFALQPMAAFGQSAVNLEGSWRGNGFLQPTSGQKEKVRCRVNYSKISDKIYSVSGTCASPSGNVRQTGEVIKVSDTRFVGDFKNAEYDISGRVRIILNGSRQTMTLTSSSGTGSLNLRKR